MQMFARPRSRTPIAAARAHAVWFTAFVVLCAGALTGCGSIAFKRGSGPDSLAADRQACQARDPDPTRVRACLSGAGWKITDLDPASPPSAAVPTPQPAPSSPAQAAPMPAAGVQAAAPTRILRVGGWWKFDADAADLQSAAGACVAKLGPANAPGAGYHSVTPAFYACLRGAGWHGLARPAS